MSWIELKDVRETVVSVRVSTACIHSVLAHLAVNNTGRKVRIGMRGMWRKRTAEDLIKVLPLLRSRWPIDAVIAVIAVIALIVLCVGH